MSRLKKGAQLAAFLSLIVALALLLTGHLPAALALTIGSGVVIISGLWLERVLWYVAQPGRPRLTAGFLWHTGGRLAFLAAWVVAVYCARNYLELWAVALGISIGVLGWAWSGLQRE